MGTVLRDLYRGLHERERPEVVAEKVFALLEDEGVGLSRQERGAFPPLRYRGSSMSERWETPADLSRSLGVLETLTGIRAPRADDPRAIRDYLDSARAVAHMRRGDSSFKNDRMNKGARKVAGLGYMSRRRYNKLFRLIVRLDEYVVELEDQQDLTALARFAKIGFAESVSWQDFRRSSTSAAFVAYYTANLARRSLFLVGPQARAFDVAAQILLSRCESDPNASWRAIAHVFPRDDVLSRLALEDRVDMLDAARAKMTDVAGRLREIAEKAGDGLNLKEMIVSAGNDSSTWNALAGAWNKARDVWVATAWTVNPFILDAVLPGKVLRLMAADVAYLHRTRKGGLDPDTEVWARLPRPWEVLDGSKSCTRQDVIDACVAMGVNPEKSGWAKPRPRTTIEVVRETPESVHGVVISHPQLAELLRRAGYFSGYEERAREIAPVLEGAARAELADHHARHIERGALPSVYPSWWKGND